MNIIKNRFQNDLDCKLTFGYETFCKRTELKLEKSHSNDSFVIAGGSSQVKNKKYCVKQKRRNNRTLQLNRNGFKPSIRKKRYSLQPSDLIKFNNKIYDVVGSHCLGTRVIIKVNNKKKSISIKKISNWVFNSKSLIWR